LVPDSCLQDWLALPVDNLELGNLPRFLEFANFVEFFDLVHHTGREAVSYRCPWQPLTGQLAPKNNHRSPLVKSRAHMNDDCPNFQPGFGSIVC
jgi:hypothetical protein